MFLHRWERKTPEKPAMASCMDGLLVHLLHGQCWVGSWAHRTQTLGVRQMQDNICQLSSLDKSINNKEVGVM